MKRNIILLTIGLCAMQLKGIAQIQRSTSFMPLGVYWPGEYTYSNLSPELRWNKIETDLLVMQKDNVNAIWLTHTDEFFAAELARRAQPRGIYIVASLAYFDASEPTVRQRTDADHKSKIESVLKNWGDAPKCIAWGLGDESDPSNPDVQRWINVWKTYFPNESTTGVHMYNQVDAAKNRNYTALTSDVYPFFVAPYGYNGFGSEPGPEASLRLVTMNVTDSPTPTRPWMMAQGYQEVNSGPTTFDQEGNLLYRSGGAATRGMPTPTQSSWQAWRSIANGAKGIFYFLYRTDSTGMNASDPQPEISQKSWRYLSEFNTGAPLGLVYDQGTKRNTPSVQFDSIGSAFKKIQNYMSIIGGAELVKSPEAWFAATQGTAAQISVFKNSQTKARSILIISDYGGTNNTITFKVGPHILTMKNYISGANVPLSMDIEGFRTGTVTLSAGDGQLYTCTIDTNNLPVSYFDNFQTDKFEADAKQTTNLTTYSTNYGRMLYPTIAGQDLNSAYAIYDVDNILAPLPTGGVRVLEYNATGESTTIRGVHWWKSNIYPMQLDTAWIPATMNQYNFGKPFTERYIRVGISNGEMKYFGVSQWKSKATLTNTNITEEIKMPVSVSFYHNPANRLLTISYSLSKSSIVQIFLFDVMGKKVMQVLNKNQNGGEHKLNMNTESLTNGIYFVKMIVNDELLTQKLEIFN